MQLTILGSSSATPTLSRHQTAQVLSFHKEHFLLDCGESAQLQMLRYGINQNRVSCVFISHLHPDHFTGLIGFLTTQSLQKRRQPLYIYGPSGIEPIINTQLQYTGGHLSFPLHFHSLDHISDEDLLFQVDGLRVSAIRVEHGLPCYGFLFEEEDKRYKLSKVAIEATPPPKEAFQFLQYGHDFKDESGDVYYARDYILENPLKRSFAYITDTLVQFSLAEKLSGVTMLYHEATFTKEFARRARETYHSTSEDAAKLAAKMGVQKLLIGHFSARFGNLQPLLDEATAIFPNTFLAEEGLSFAVPATPLQTPSNA